MQVLGTQYAFFNPLNAELNPIRHLLALVGARHIVHVSRIRVNPLNAELNPFCHLLALVGAHHIVHISGIRFNLLHLEFGMRKSAVAHSEFDFIICGLDPSDHAF